MAAEAAQPRSLPCFCSPDPRHFAENNRQQQAQIAFLKGENLTLKECLNQELGARRLRLTDVQRRRLAELGKPLGRKLLGELAGIVTPDTILRWYRKLVAQKFDSSKNRQSPGRPRVKEDVEKLVVQIAGIPLHPHEEYMCQCVRNLTDDFDGFLKHKRYLIHDRDDKFSKKFDKTLRDAGVGPVVLPPRSPNLNAYAERFVLSVKSEC